MTNAATVIREHRALCADVDMAWGGTLPDELLTRQGKQIYPRVVRLLHMLDQVDESEVHGSLGSELAEIRCHLESTLWGLYATATLAPKLAGLSKQEQGRRLEAELAALSRKADEIWGKLKFHQRRGPGLQTRLSDSSPSSDLSALPPTSAVRRCNRGEARQMAQPHRASNF
jgi:hypothetical protein